jgi:hypothetical protein
MNACERKSGFILSLFKLYARIFAAGFFKVRFDFTLAKLSRHARARGFAYKMVTRMTRMF